MPFRFRAAALPAAFCLLFPAFGLAEDVTLLSRSGAQTVSGTLIAFDGETYRLDTRWGRLTVEASAVECDGPGCPQVQHFAPELRVMADATLAGLVLPDLLRAWALREGLTLATTPEGWTLSRAGVAELHLRRVEPTTSDLSAALAAGDADAALAPPLPGAQRGPGQPVARLPLLLASAPEAPQGILSRSALRTARSSDPHWTGLTGTDQPLHWHSFAPFTDLATLERFGPSRFAPQSAASLTALTEALKRDPWGLALLPAPLPEGLQQREVADSCGLTRDVSPFALSAGEHPLAMPVLWHSAPRRLPGAARDFADFVISRPALEFSLRDALPLSAQGTRLANGLLAENPDVTLSDLQQALSSLRDARRLPLTIRFDRSGSPDGEGRAALSHLTRLIESGALRGHNLLLAGFSDSEGSGSDNRKRSLARAEAMAALLRRSLPDGRPLPELHSAGFGEALPIACDDSAEGRHLNRRVELWLTPAR